MDVTSDRRTQLDRQLLRLELLRMVVVALLLGVFFGVPAYAIANGWSTAGELLLSGLGAPAAAYVLVFVVMALSGRIEELQREERLLMAETDTRSPVLALRSMMATALTVSPTTRRFAGVRSGGYIHAPGSTWLEHLGVASRLGGQVVLLGEDHALSTHVSSGALVIDAGSERWFEAFRILSAAARLIVAIPDTSGGLAREIEALRDSGLLARTLFVMPPTPAPPAGRSIVQEGPDVAERWAEARAFWRARGAQLPAYDPCGCVFRPGYDLAPLERRSLEGKPEGLGAVVACLAATMEDRGSPLAGALEAWAAVKSGTSSSGSPPPS